MLPIIFILSAFLNLRKTNTNFSMSIHLSFCPSVRTEHFGFTWHIVTTFHSWLIAGKKHHALCLKTPVCLCWVSHWILSGREETQKKRRLTYHLKPPLSKSRFWEIITKNKAQPTCYIKSNIVRRKFWITWRITEVEKQIENIHTYGDRNIACN